MSSQSVSFRERSVFPKGLKVSHVLPSPQGPLVADELVPPEVVDGDVSILAIGSASEGFFPSDSGQRSDQIYSHRWHAKLDYLVDLLEIGRSQAHGPESEAVQSGDDAAGIRRIRVDVDIDVPRVAGSTMKGQGMASHYHVLNPVLV